MTYAPTGGLVAAPTAGLPEQVGGERNWDYRYTWVRDASFSVYALLGLGFTEEAAAFGRWLRRPRRRAGRRRTAGRSTSCTASTGPRDLTEEILDHWEGYRGLAPGADRQRRRRPAPARHLRRGAGQHLLRRPARPRRPATAAGGASATLLDWLADNWDQPEEGIWETRGGRQDFTYGRLMSWVAFDRGIRLATAHGRPAPLERWTAAARRDLRADHGARAGAPTRQAFVQHYGDRRARLVAAADVAGRVHRPDRPDVALDAATRWTRSSSPTASSTATTPRPHPTGCAAPRARSRCARFTYVDALARAGRLDEARLTFEKMLTYANHLGLYSEEIALDRRAARQLPAGVHAPRADRRRDHPGRPARPGSGSGPGRTGRAPGPLAAHAGRHRDRGGRDHGRPVSRPVMRRPRRA